MVFAFGKPTCTTGVVGNLSPTLTAGTPRLIFTTHTDDKAKKFLLTATTSGVPRQRVRQRPLSHKEVWHRTTEPNPALRCALMTVIVPTPEETQSA
jgi:hypothetical protein